MLVSRPYRVKNLPRLPGAFEPWIALWQLRHARATRRVLTPGFGCPVLVGGQFGYAVPLTVVVAVSPAWQL
jgi:hypothetical protein